MWRMLRLIARWFGALFASRPAPDGPRERSRPFYVIGHRGSPCSEVENTIQSYETAVERDGANGIELDLCLTADGVVVVWHDWDPEDSICDIRARGLEPDVIYCPCIPGREDLHKPISQLQCADVVANFGYVLKKDMSIQVHGVIPLFDEVMAWAVKKSSLEILFLDIKIPASELDIVPRMLDAIDEILRRHKPKFRVVFETSIAEVLEAMKRHAPHHDFTLDISAPAGITIDPLKFSAMGEAIARGNQLATAQRPRQITAAPWTTYQRIVEHDVSIRDHTRGEPPTLICFTVNAEEEMRWLLGMGIDGIQTDRPDLLRRVAGETRPLHHRLPVDGNGSAVAVGNAGTRQPLPR
ncbi:MAG: glycerophosphoryl diester phosphodiesterase [Chlorobi bacterium]|nr:glycerophosphoryl diester phosphodiesterase [Chlorobiota bacterium]